MNYRRFNTIFVHKYLYPERNISLFFLVFMLSFTLSAQEKITFVTGYSPNTIYEQNISNIIQTEMLFSGNPEIIEYIEAEQGNPTINEERQLQVLTIVTGSEASTGFFPFFMEFMGMQNELIPDGTRIYGRLKFPAIFDFDSVSGTQLDHEQQRFFLQGMQDLIRQFPFPNRALAIGDTFSEITPIEMPMGEMAVKMNILTLYKLQRIENGEAVFSIKQELQASMNMTDLDEEDIDMTGTGLGIMHYDMENKFITYNEMSFIMNFSFDVKETDVNIEVKQSTSILQRCKISVNLE